MREVVFEVKAVFHGLEIDQIFEQPGYDVVKVKDGRILSPDVILCEMLPSVDQEGEVYDFLHVDPAELGARAITITSNIRRQTDEEMQESEENDAS